MRTLLGAVVGKGTSQLRLLGPSIPLTIVVICHSAGKPTRRHCHQPLNSWDDVSMRVGVLPNAYRKRESLILLEEAQPFLGFVLYSRFLWQRMTHQLSQMGPRRISILFVQIVEASTQVNCQDVVGLQVWYRQISGLSSH